jgi:hypothetical protein
MSHYEYTVSTMVEGKSSEWNENSRRRRRTANRDDVRTGSEDSDRGTHRPVPLEGSSVASTTQIPHRPDCETKR